MSFEIITGMLITMLTEFIHVLCFKKCINEPLKISPSKIGVLAIVSVLNCLNNLHTIIIFRITVSLILLIVLNYYWFKKEIKQTIITSIVISIISILLEFGVTYVISKAFANVNELNENILAKNSYTVMFACILYYIFCIRIIVESLKKVINYVGKIVNVGNIFILVIILLSVMLTRHNESYSNYNFIYNTVILGITSIFLLISLKEYYKKEIYKIKSDDMQEKIESYEKMADDYRELKHNLNTDLMAIRSIADKSTQKVVDEKIKKYNKNYEWIIDLNKVPKGIQGLIYLKLNDIKKSEITLQVDSKVDEEILKNIPVKLYSKVCDILGVLIDNAIEGSKTSVEKTLYIGIQNIEEEINIRIINTFQNMVDLEKIGKKNYSTKEIKSGRGLNYINRIRNKKIQIKKEIINELFIVSLSISI